MVAATITSARHAAIAQHTSVYLFCPCDGERKSTVTNSCPPTSDICFPAFDPRYRTFRLRPRRMSLGLDEGRYAAYKPERARVLGAWDRADCGGGLRCGDMNDVKDQALVIRHVNLPVLIDPN
jgi:hypothetical protein